MGDKESFWDNVSQERARQQDDERVLNLLSNQEPLKCSEWEKLIIDPAFQEGDGWWSLHTWGTAVITATPGFTDQITWRAINALSLLIFKTPYQWVDGRKDGRVDEWMDLLPSRAHSYCSIKISFHVC